MFNFYLAPRMSCSERLVARAAWGPAAVCELAATAWAAAAAWGLVAEARRSAAAASTAAPWSPWTPTLWHAAPTLGWVARLLVLLLWPAIVVAWPEVAGKQTPGIWQTDELIIWTNLLLGRNSRKLSKIGHKILKQPVLEYRFSFFYFLNDSIFLGGRSL